MLPTTLSTGLTAALAWLERTGTVSIWHRQSIYLALGPSQPLIPVVSDTMSEGARRRLERQQRYRGGIPVFAFQQVYGAQRTLGHIRRTALAIKTLEYDFPLWQDSRWYRQHTREAFQRLIHVVQQIYAGQPPHAMAMDRLRMSVFDAFRTDEILLAAAGVAYEVAIADVDLQCDTLIPFRNDAELDALSRDVAGIAAIAADEQAPVFWAWWLTHAVPAAWAAHPESQAVD